MGGRVELSGSVSSQYLTALLMAAPLCQGSIEIEIVDELISKPYVEMTITLMERFGVKVEKADDLQSFKIQGGKSTSPRVVRSSKEMLLRLLISSPVPRLLVVPLRSSDAVRRVFKGTQTSRTPWNKWVRRSNGDQTRSLALDLKAR